MALFDTLLSAFKGGERTRVPLACGMMDGWHPAFESGPAARSYEYQRAIAEGFLANPIAQRSVRLLAEGIGQAPLTCSDPRLAALVTATSAGQSLIETLAANLLLHGNGYGPANAPHVTWQLEAAVLRLTLSERASLVGAYGSAALWVRQIGTYDRSQPLLLTYLS